jgi:hypothetical protein
MSTLSFTGTLSDTDSKIIDNTDAAPASQYKMHLLPTPVNNLLFY